jgi:uncharacterized damage-inducible protein DinB
MAEELEGDLSEAVFWGADLSRSRFRDVNFTGAAMKNVWLIDVDIDGLVDRLVINGVDVTDYVNANDPWQPLRGMLRPTTVAQARAAWAELERAWAETLADASRLTDEQRRQPVDGEWSFQQTLRHLVFAIDKWFTVPIDGGQLAAIGMPNSGSVDYGWPGIDRDADPSYDEVLAVRADRSRRFGELLERLSDDELHRDVEVMENGTVPLIECICTVLEEEFEHRRYAMRDLATLTAERS